MQTITIAPSNNVIKDLRPISPKNLIGLMELIDSGGILISKKEIADHFMTIHLN
jgi:hypothetical protein